MSKGTFIMAIVKIRKLVTTIDEIHSEMGKIISPPTRRAAAIAVIQNPFAEFYQENLEDLMSIGEQLGSLLGKRCIEALGIKPSEVESYGKAALIGENGELEHGAALLHPRMGASLRREVGKGAALVPSSKKRGSMGDTLDIPLGHKDAAYIRSHFDSMEVRVNDAPRANEILVAIAITDSGRPLPRVGGLKAEEAEGKDGLR